MSNITTIPAILIPADITQPVRVVELNADNPLESMYPILSCRLVQPISVPLKHIERAMMWIDEEGLCIDNPRFNSRASIICNHPLVGDAILAGDNGENIVPFEMGCPAQFFKILQAEAEAFEKDGIPTASDLIQ